jgi:hypothetical protein
VRPTTHGCIGEETLTSTGSSNTVAANVPKGCSAMQLTVETTSCRMTLTSAGDPTSASAGGRIIQKDQMPWFMTVGQGVFPKFASTGGTTSVIQIAYFS